MRRFNRNVRCELVGPLCEMCQFLQFLVFFALETDDIFTNGISRIHATADPYSDSL